MNKLISTIRDERRPMHERVFILLGSLALAGSVAAALAGVALGEDY